MRTMRALALACIVLMLCLSEALAAEPDESKRLFRDLYYGMSQAELEAKGAIVPLGSAKNGPRGRLDVEFSGKRWRLICQFASGTLDYVILHSRDGSAQRRSAVLRTLEAEGYTLVAVRADGEVRATPAELLRSGTAGKTLTDVTNETTRYKDARYVLIKDERLRQGSVEPAAGSVSSPASNAAPAAKASEYALRVDMFAAYRPPAQSCRVIFSFPQRATGGKSMDTGPEKQP